MPLLISLVASLAITYFLLPHLMKFLHATGIVGLDMHKANKPRLPASGGIGVACGVLAGILIYTGLQTFIYGNSASSLYLLTAVASIVIIAFTGMLDDLNVKSRPVVTKDGKNIKIGFPQWLKPLLVLPAAIPLMVMNVGDTTMAVPFVGDVNFGILYPLLIIPIGVLGASNMVNMLGGFNGLEAGMGLVYTLGLGIYSLMYGNQIAAIIFLSTSASLIAFLKYNWYPAKILPGDSLTYLLGAIVAVGVIVGNMEKVGLIVMIPFIAQGIWKAYHKFKFSDLGVLQKDGTIKPQYKGTYSLTHIAMKLGNFKEYQISIILILAQVVFAIIPFIIRI